MLRSMTAFARQDKSSTYGNLSWELRSVNHRYLECYVRLPEEFRRFEAEVKKRVGARLNRGKVECAFTFKPGDAGDHLEINENLSSRLIELADQLHRKMRNPGAISPVDVMRWPGVLENPAPDMQAIEQDMFDSLDKAVDELVTTREREGEKLRQALEERRVGMQKIVVQVRKRIPQILEEVRQRLLARFEELQLQLDENRLEQEMVLIIQKSDVEEEMKRLETHLEELERILNTQDDQPVGRRLDFLMQELNREANTLCSKSMDSETTKSGIDLKVYIEQMREQIQNIE